MGVLPSRDLQEGSSGISESYTRATGGIRTCVRDFLINRANSGMRPSSAPGSPDACTLSVQRGAHTPKHRSGLSPLLRHTRSKKALQEFFKRRSTFRKIFLQGSKCRKRKGASSGAVQEQYRQAFQENRANIAKRAGHPHQPAE